MTLEHEPFERLLALFGPDRDRAGERYEAIRRALVKFFECKGGRFAEEMADETLDRVARRLAEGETIRAADPAAYVHGVARNVLRGDWTQRQRAATRAAAEPEPAPPDDEGAARVERRLACLDRCLAALSPETRLLVLRYYVDERRAKIDGRRALADALGIGQNALRIRMHRIRARLESCVRVCLGDETEGETGHTGTGDQE
jgi:DNA-directed RNA polymerase specialized sigma24 family protein